MFTPNSKHWSITHTDRTVLSFDMNVYSRIAPAHFSSKGFYQPPVNGIRNAFCEGHEEAAYHKDESEHVKKADCRPFLRFLDRSVRVSIVSSEKHVELANTKSASSHDA